MTFLPRLHQFYYMSELAYHGTHKAHRPLRMDGNIAENWHKWKYPWVL